MVGIDDFIVGFAASYIAGNVPVISSLLSKHQGLYDKIEACYAKAIKKWSRNAQIRESEYPHYNSLTNLVDYFARDNVSDKSEVSKLLAIWTDELRNDPICYSAILEIKGDLASARQSEYYTDLRNLILQNSTQQYQTFHDASSSLRNVWAYVGDKYHIERKETEDLYSWLKQEHDVTKQENIAMLLGGPGQGKSVILRDLLLKLETEGITVLGLKSDLLFDTSDTDINKKLQIGVSVQAAIKEEAQDKKVVLIVDQIDALSSTLSSDRRPLSVLNTLIADVISDSNVSIVISCRPYDLDYDSSLERYRRCKRVPVNGLNASEVEKALATVGMSAEVCTPQLLELLRIPQNLFLFTRLKKHDFPVVSQNSLYDALWKEVINDCPQDGITTSVIVNYLSVLTKKLYERQTLTINTKALESKWAKVQSYLIVSGILTNEDVYGNIQFIHQTLFDYVYARLFFESGQTLHSAFEDVHQGLFVRPRLRQILDYQRVIDIDNYIESLTRILFAKESDKYIYRYQLRHLTLSLLAHQMSLYVAEKLLVSNRILRNVEYRSLFIASARSLDSFHLICTYINEEGGFCSVDKELKAGVLGLAERICSTNPEVLKYILSICTPELDADSRKRISRIVDFCQFDSNPPEIERISDFLEDGAQNIETSQYYERLCLLNPDKVIERLCRLVNDAVSKEDRLHLFDVNLPLQASCVYSYFKEHNQERFVDLCMSLIEVMSKEKIGILDEDIQTSRLFYMYNRHNMNLYLSDKILGGLFEYLESGKCDREQKDKLIRESIEKPVDVFHIIGIVGCLSETNSYTDVAYEYLKDNINKSHHSSPLDYYQKELFAKVFMLLNLKQQRELMAQVSHIAPDWENVALKDSSFVSHPISRVGYTRAQYYSSIPYDYLSKHFLTEKKFLDEMHRKYKSIENKEPNAMHSMTGWTTMESSAYEKMKDGDILGSMEKYNLDFNTDWDIPTKTGHAMALRSMAEKSPEKYYDIYKKALSNPSIDRFYVIEGIEGLMKGGLEETKINELLESLIDGLDLEDINKNDAGLLIQITRSASYYFDNDKVIPAFFFNFIRNVALNANDEVEEVRRYDINDGINRVRGCACDYLVQCGVDPSYSTAVFETLEMIGVKASSATRCAALFQIGMLLNVDRKKTIDVVLKMTSDYNSDILSLPLHRLNPLLYLNSKEFEKFVPYFKASITCPESHSVATPLLLRYYLTDKKGSKELLLEMADKSGISRVELVRGIKDYYRPQYHDKCVELLVRYLDKDEADLGRCYDDVFPILGDWKSDVELFVDKITNSPICKYCNREVYNFLDRVAITNPNLCLIWLTNIYGFKKELDDFNKSVDRIITILVSAYNAMRKFDKSNPVLEKAMDLLDEVLSSDYNRWDMNKCLNKLDN